MVNAAADEERLRLQIAITKLNIARLSALMQAQPEKAFVRPSDVSDLAYADAMQDLIREFDEQEARQETLKARLNENATRQQASETMITENRAMRDNILKRFEARSALEKQGFVSAAQLSELELDLIRHNSDLKNEISKLAILKAEATTIGSETRLQRAEWLKSVRERLRQEQQALIDLQQEKVKANERSQQHFVTAPVSGTVQQIKAQASNGVLSQGQELMTLVPDGVELLAEINLLNKDVGFVLPGQEVEVKIDSFPYTKYGTVKAEVRNISRDSMQDERLGLVFPTYLTLSKSEIAAAGETIDLTSGMTITAEIKTGDRQILSYILSPLEEYQSEALRER
jgi:RTX toxin transport system membrane fusion protein